ncbi:9465_t:CDS:2, partial [Racocetra fulgida]
FWESTDEPSLRKFLDFRLRSGNLEDMKTEHNRYNGELKTLSEHYAKISEVGRKVQNWKAAFKETFWKLNEEKEHLNAKKNLLEEKSRLDIMQAQAEMTQVQQLNKGALSNLEQVVSTVASAKNKRVFDNDHDQAQPPPKKLLHVNEEYSEIKEREDSKIQKVAVISSTITKRENLRNQKVAVISSTITERENSRTQKVAAISNTIKPLLDTYNKAFTIQKSIFDDILLDFDVVMEKPYNGTFDYKQHYILLWVQELLDPKQSEFSYREHFISPILARAFDDLDVIRFRTGEIENILTKTQRNETEQQEHRIRLGCNQDGIIDISLNVMDLEIGFMEVVGSAIDTDLKKLSEDTEKVFK